MASQGYWGDITLFVSTTIISLTITLFLPTVCSHHAKGQDSWMRCHTHDLDSSLASTQRAHNKKHRRAGELNRSVIKSTACINIEKDVTKISSQCALWKLQEENTRRRVLTWSSHKQMESENGKGVPGGHLHFSWDGKVWMFVGIVFLLPECLAPLYFFLCHSLWYCWQT